MQMNFVRFPHLNLVFHDTHGVISCIVSGIVPYINIHQTNIYCYGICVHGLPKDRQQQNLLINLKRLPTSSPTYAYIPHIFLSRPNVHQMVNR